MPPLWAADGLFGRLVAAAKGPWRDYTEHDFVRGLGDGDLPRAAFQRYLVQDYLFLIHFCRAYGLAIYKTSDLADMRAFQATLDAILNHEMALHISYSAEWGLSEANQKARYYQLTAAGKAQLSREQNRWSQLVHAIGRIMNARPSED